MSKGHHELFPNKTIPKVKIPNMKIPNRTINLCKNPEHKNPEKGKGTKLDEEEGTKLGEHCSKVRSSQNRMPIEPLTQQQFGIFTFRIITIFGIWDFYVQDCLVRKKFVAPSKYLIGKVLIRIVASSLMKIKPGNTKGGSITVPLTSCLTCSD
jgi:hypothetical protein